MKNFDIALSLNREVTISASTYEEAERQLKTMLKNEGIDESLCTLEIFDVNEEEIENT